MSAKILVVDDEQSIRRLLRNTLERAGHQVIEAVDGRSALAIAAAERPNAVLLDLGLPDRDGLALVHRLALESGAAIIIISGRAQVQGTALRLAQELLEVPAAVKAAADAD